MDDARSVLAARLGAKLLHRILGGGYTLMEHWLVELDGERAFAKVAVDEPTAGFLRDEHRVYSAVEASFLPRLINWDDDGERPILVLEDLTEAPAGLPRLTLDELHTWREVEADPAPFLGLGLCSAEWLAEALPELLRATDRCEVGGDAFAHLDTRSDNICIVESGAKLVDWNWAGLGNPLVDLAFWLPSLFAEGGPPPTEILADAGDLPAIVSGFFAPIAGLPPPAGAPTVRPLQLVQLKVALPWAVEVLGLPPLDR
jgi:hypothetical protein